MRKGVTAVVASVAVLAGVLAGPPVPAGASEVSEAAQRCRTEFATLVGSGGERFATAGQCVSFVARGGTLAPPAFVDVFLTYSPLFEGGITLVTINVSGLTGEKARLYEEIGGFVLDVEVFASEFPMEQTWSCAADGLIRVTDPLTGASDTEVFAPFPESCAGMVEEG